MIMTLSCRASCDQTGQTGPSHVLMHARAGSLCTSSPRQRGARMAFILSEKAPLGQASACRVIASAKNVLLHEKHGPFWSQYNVWYKIGFN